MRFKKLMIISFLFLSFILISCNKNEAPEKKNETPVEKLWGYNDLKRFDNYKNLQSFYKKIDSIYSDFNNSKNDIGTMTVSEKTDLPEKNYGVIKKENYISYGLTQAETASVVKIYSLDHPAYYWISDDILINSTDVSLSVEAKFSKADKRKEIKDKITTSISSLKTKISDDFSKYDIIKAIHNYILDISTYDDNKTFEAYNILGTLVEGKGVCEAYAKTFQYLAQLYDIECILAVGTAKTSPRDLDLHAWNLVKLEGLWYGVDTTFDDSLNNKNDFLLTSDDMAYTYFPSTDNSLDDKEYYTYILPEISANKYSC